MRQILKFVQNFGVTGVASVFLCIPLENSKTNNKAKKN